RRAYRRRRAGRVVNVDHSEAVRKDRSTTRTARGIDLRIRSKRIGQYGAIKHVYELTADIEVEPFFDLEMAAEVPIFSWPARAAEVAVKRAGGRSNAVRIQLLPRLGIQHDVRVWIVAVDIVNILQVQRFARNADILAGEEIRSRAVGRRQENAALIRGEEPELPVPRDLVHDFGRGSFGIELGNGVGEIERQRLRRNLLQRPRIRVGVEEVLGSGSRETLAPGICTASLEPVREALGRLDLQGVILAVASRGSRGSERPKLRERIQGALERRTWESGVRKRIPQSGPDLDTVDRAEQKGAVGIVVVSCRAGSRV